MKLTSLSITLFITFFVNYSLAQDDFLISKKQIDTLEKEKYEVQDIVNIKLSEKELKQIEQEKAERLKQEKTREAKEQRAIALEKENERRKRLAHMQKIKANQVIDPLTGFIIDSNTLDENGKVVRYLIDPKTGKRIGYIDGKVIRNMQGAVIGYVDENGNIIKYFGDSIAFNAKSKTYIFKYTNYEQIELSREELFKRDIADLNKNGFVNYKNITLDDNSLSQSVDREYIITPEYYIHGVVETAINSEIQGGEFNVLLIDPVYSLDTGRLLLPDGTRFVCSYKEVEIGQKRLGATCRLAILPNGKKIKVSAIQVYDLMGRLGLVGTVDNRMWEKYGEMFMMTGINSGAMVAASEASKTNSLVGDIVTYNGMEMMDETMDILEDRMDLNPIITISSGTSVILRTKQDLDLNSLRSIKHES